ncbi:VWA domain-containing protein [Fluviicola sp.]|uniref:VWA domain-containing protein n=1 Tax=Fluviicola sp. TaxID=1917219 RepID=UPI0031DD6A6D
MTSIKYFLFAGCIIFSTVCRAQKRNQAVRELNHVVELMNAFSLCNQDWYFDAVQLQKAMNRSSQKVNESYFYCSKTQHSGLLSYTNIEQTFRFKEITPNAQNQIPAYQADYIPWLEARETVLKVLSKPKNEYSAFAPFLNKYLASTDSLYATHEALNEYVSEKKFRSDKGFETAKSILRTHGRWFRECYVNSKELDSALVDYCNFHYPPFGTHKELQQGLQELNLTMIVLMKWEKELYAENMSNTAKYDARIRQLNAEGLKNDSLYLYKTRGYGVLHSGFWLHTRYRTFYTSMQSRIYWFASSRFPSEPYLKQSQQAYNDFVRSYNAIVEDYNDYIAIADGLTFRKTSDCCLSPSEIDTNQNVLLMAPKLLYKFEYTEEINEPLPKDSVPSNLSKEELLIQQAAPHHLVYLLDASSSMNESGKLSHLKENAVNLVNMQREIDRISIVTFSGKSDILLQSVPCNQKKHIHEKIEHIHAFGQTNIQRGFETVKSLLASDKLEKGVNAVLLLTDGEFLLNAETQALLNQLKSDSIAVYFIYLGKPLGKKQAKAFQKTYTDMGVVLYDTNKIDLKEALLKVATQ